LAQSTIEGLKSNPDRAVRKSGWNNYADSHLQFKNTLAAFYGTTVKQNTTMYPV